MTSIGRPISLTTMFVYADELQYSVYNFEMAEFRRCGSCSISTKGRRRRLLKLYDGKAENKKRFPLLPAYDQVLKCSNLFNTLDARGAISVTERVGIIQRVRKLAVGVAQAWADQQTRQRGRAMSLPFLLEIGTEEIPDWMIPSALENLRAAVREARIPARIGAPGCHSAPSRAARRRIARSPGRSEERVMGPPKSAPAASRGRIRAQARRQPEELAVESTPKGEYYVIHRKVEGRRIIDILAEALPGIILGIYFPKTMYWTGKSGPRFIRPIRWIVALLGEEIVPFELAGVHSGNMTSGHRRLGAREIAVTVADYEQRLRENYVILSAEERRDADQSRIRGHRASKPDAALLETLVYLTEYPDPIPADSIRSSSNCRKRCWSP